MIIVIKLNHHIIEDLCIYLMIHGHIFYF